MRARRCDGRLAARQRRPFLGAQAHGVRRIGQAESPVERYPRRTATRVHRRQQTTRSWPEPTPCEPGDRLSARRQRASRAPHERSPLALAVRRSGFRGVVRLEHRPLVRGRRTCRAGHGAASPPQCQGVDPGHRRRNSDTATSHTRHAQGPGRTLRGARGARPRGRGDPDPRTRRHPRRPSDSPRRRRIRRRTWAGGGWGPTPSLRGVWRRGRPRKRSPRRRGSTGHLPRWLPTRHAPRRDPVRGVARTAAPRKRALPRQLRAERPVRAARTRRRAGPGLAGELLRLAPRTGPVQAGARRLAPPRLAGHKIRRRTVCARQERRTGRAIPSARRLRDREPRHQRPAGRGSPRDPETADADHDAHPPREEQHAHDRSGGLHGSLIRVHRHPLRGSARLRIEDRPGGRPGRLSRHRRSTPRCLLRGWKRWTQRR